jgi:isopenicillin N synthase-like dioxygenase
VRGSNEERISVPLFFNPNYDMNVAPMGADHVVLAGVHLTKRFNETYVHLKA